MSMTEYERLQELLYRLREIMSEIGENPVADEMFNMVFEYAENIDEDVVEVVRCKDCIHHRQLDRTDSYEDSFIEGCLWRMLGAETELCRNSFATTAKKEKARMNNNVKQSRNKRAGNFREGTCRTSAKGHRKQSGQAECI